MSYARATEPTTVAVVYAADGTIYDQCFGWEAGQTYANDGYRVVATADDGTVTVDRAQRLYDAELTAALDCFGPQHAK